MVAVVSESVNGRPWMVFAFGKMGLEYGNKKRVCTPFDVVHAFFVSILIVLKFVGEYEKAGLRAPAFLIPRIF